MSQQGISILKLSVKATAAIVARRFVTIGGTVAAAGVTALGVSDFAGAIGDDVTVHVVGTWPVEAGAAIAAGSAIESDATGRAIPLAAGIKLGRTLQAATAAGQFIEVFLIPN